MSQSLRIAGGPVRLQVARRSALVGCWLAAALLVVAGVTLCVGDYPIPPADLLRTLAGHGTPGQTFVVQQLRLPRLLTGLLVGAALAVGGALFQSLSRNPLGSPDIVGLNAGAATGALLVILVVQGSTAQVAGGAIAGGVGAAILVYLLAVTSGIQGYRLIIVGIGVAAGLTSVNSYLLLRADLSSAQTALVWLTGSLNGRGWEHVLPILIVAAVLIPLAVASGRSLRMLEMGEDAARRWGCGWAGSGWPACSSASGCRPPRRPAPGRSCSLPSRPPRSPGA